MRKAIWRNILSIRTFPVGTSRGMARRSVLVSAVPRLKRRIKVASSRGRGRSVWEVGNGFSGPCRGLDAPGKVFVRKAESIVHAPLFSGHTKFRSGMMVRSVQSSSRPVSSVMKTKSRAAIVPDIVVARKQVSRPVEKPVRSVGTWTRSAPAIARGMAAVRRPIPIAAVAMKRRRHNAAAGAPVLRKAVRTGVRGGGRAAARSNIVNGVSYVPVVRRAVTSGQSHEGIGQEHARHQPVLGSEHYHEPEASDAHLDHGAGHVDFLLGNRRSRLTARRSGSGVDEIMQPQYPGRSIGFF